jgi:hypothetical protein
MQSKVARKPANTLRLEALDERITGSCFGAPVGNPPIAALAHQREYRAMCCANPIVAATVALALGCASPTRSEPNYVQPADQFAAALANLGTSPSFVLITAINNSTNGQRTGCIPAPFLIEAILMENGLSWSDESVRKAREIARSSADHVYRFWKPEALAALGFDSQRRNAAACEIIRGGFPAFQSDRSGEIRAGQP